MNKIIIIGCPGSGKSTLAKVMAKQLNINLYHLDALFWKPNWIMTDTAQQICIQKQIMQKDNWIIDGNYSGTIDLRIRNADTIIMLKLSRYQCLFGALKRIITHYNKQRLDMGEGCKERFNIGFLKYIWNFSTRIEPVLLDKLAQLNPEKKVIILKSRKDTSNFIQTLNKNQKQIT